MTHPASSSIDELVSKDTAHARAKLRLVVSLIGAGADDARRVAAVLGTNQIKAEVRLGQLQERWVSVRTVALPTTRLWALPTALGALTSVNEPVSGQLLIEAPRAPELARLALSVIREDPCFAAVNALIAVAASEVHRVRPDWGFSNFIIHPYRPEELHWRLCALHAQRTTARDSASNLANVSIDLGAHEVSVEGKKISLTHKEFALLKCLLASNGNVLSRQQLLNHVWGDDYSGGRRTVDTHVRRLRSKLGPTFPLLTVRGAGYRLSR